jgi:hypothetical protein
MFDTRNMPRPPPEPQESLGQDVGDLVKPLLGRHLFRVGRVRWSPKRTHSNLPVGTGAVSGAWPIEGPPANRAAHR